MLAYRHIRWWLKALLTLTVMTHCNAHTACQRVSLKLINLAFQNTFKQFVVLLLVSDVTSLAGPKNWGQKPKLQTTLWDFHTAHCSFLSLVLGHHRKASRESSVNIVTVGHQLDNQGIVVRFLAAAKRPDRLRTTPPRKSPIQWVIGWLSPGVKR